MRKTHTRLWTSSIYRPPSLLRSRLHVACIGELGGALSLFRCHREPMDVRVSKEQGTDDMGYQSDDQTLTYEVDGSGDLPSVCHTRYHMYTSTGMTCVMCSLRKCRRNVFPRMRWQECIGALPLSYHTSRCMYVYCCTRIQECDDRLVNLVCRWCGHRCCCCCIRYIPGTYYTTINTYSKRTAQAVSTAVQQSRNNETEKNDKIQADILPRGFLVVLLRVALPLVGSASVGPRHHFLFVVVVFIRREWFCARNDHRTDHDYHTTVAKIIQIRCINMCRRMRSTNLVLLILLSRSNPGNIVVLLLFYGCCTSCRSNKYGSTTAPNRQHNLLIRRTRRRCGSYRYCSSGIYLAWNVSKDPMSPMCE